MRPLVLLRPEPGASQSLERARELGLEARSVPLFAVRPVPWTAPDPTAFDALLLTSANAVRHGGAELEKLRSLPVHAVGEATAAAAREAGFAVAGVGQSDAASLIHGLPKGLRLLHLAGQDRRDLPVAMAITVYDAAAVGNPDLDDLAGAVIAVHSPRAGLRLAELVTNRAATAVVAISEAAGAACGGGWERVEAAPRPSDDALLSLAARLCNNPKS